MASKDDIKRQTADSEAKLNRLFPEIEDSTSITAAIGMANYSASAIARAVEDCNAHLLNLNVTADGAIPSGYDAGEVVVDLRVDMRHAMGVIRSLERYGYRVLAATSGGRTVDVADGATEDVIDETLRERVNFLLRLID
ncbi:MAG: hypothetical protein J1E63_04900 [Muribaculaceae bacterium]|nr:hypothetical protein [Muribaculaceae bacterium]